MHKERVDIDATTSLTSLLASRFLAFGTVVELSFYGESLVVELAHRAARNLCAQFENLFSRTIEGSDVYKLNHAEGKAMRVHPHTFDLLSCALKYCEASMGAFDITIEPMLRLWDFKDPHVPGKGDLSRAVSHVGWEKVKLWEDAEGKAWAQLLDPHAGIDLGGIAKGWIADQLAGEASRLGVTGYVINLGGNVLVGGRRPRGGPWRIGIKDPACPSRSVARVAIESGSVVTSGTYERGFWKDDKRYHHILSPETGRPATVECPGVSVVCDRSIDAEGYSTTLLVLGPSRCRSFMDMHPEIRAVCYVFEGGGCRWFRE